MAWEVQGYYGRQYGWETVTVEETRAEAMEQLHCYNENEPQYPHRIRRESD
jgi:hypothetical protein